MACRCAERRQVAAAVARAVISREELQLRLQARRFGKTVEADLRDLFEKARRAGRPALKALRR